MAMARAAVVRPNMVGLCIWGSYAAKSSICSSSSALTYLNHQGRPHHHQLFYRLGPHATPVAALCRFRRAFCIRATSEFNPVGSIDSPLMQSMENKIKEHLNAESVTVKDAYGDGRHVSINVVSAAFEGQSAVNRQRMVYKAIWEELQNTVHAVDQMTTKTPAEAAAEKQ